MFSSLFYENFQLVAESKMGLCWFCSTSLHDSFKKLTPPSGPVRCVTKANQNQNIFKNLSQELTRVSVK